MLIEDSLTLTRAGACDNILDTALRWAGFIRPRRAGSPPGWPCSQRQKRLSASSTVLYKYTD